MIGKSLLHYEISDKLGKGGMGEVFRARDTKLGRDVAIKILPAELSGDPEREVRFQREARALASLQHANVASVYGFEEVGGTRFLVMELVEGPELTVRMEKGPIPVEDVLSIARQIAAGLEAAHENGIVHRDLKPANIMETADGEVKILDFGLAQAWFGDNPNQQESATSPTMTAAMTQVGAILGTAAYMSPEQARGSNVDRRSDIWAFGVILFEMLTGKKLFQGETISDTLAAVLRAEPDWKSLPVEEAPELCRLIERCLERNPKQRLRDIGEARIFLQDGGASISNLTFSQLGLDAPPAERGRSKPPVLLMVGLALACLMSGAFLGWKVLARQEPAPVLHTMIPPPANTDYDLSGGSPGPATVSPDGTKLAFTATDEEGVTRLYLRYLDKSESVSLSGTEGAAYPFWSPDNKFIGYFEPSDRKLKKVAVGGGPPVTLCLAENGKGGSWNSQGDIIFAPSYNTGIFKVPAIGGEPVQLTTPGEEYNSHRHPRFLPGGKEFIFVGRISGSGNNHVYLAALDTAITPRVIAETQTNADYVNGHLLSVREDVLMATPYAPDQDKVREGGTPLVENVLSITGAAVAVFSPSPTGMLVYQTGVSSQAGQLIHWTGIENAALEQLGDPGQVFHPSISPDGKQAILEVREASNEGTDLWLMDLETGLRTRFTFAPGDERRPCWSPTGNSVFYQSSEGGTYRIMQQPVEGQGGTAILFESAREIAPTCVSTGDMDLLLDFEREDGNIELRSLPLEAGDDEITTLATSPEGNLGGGVYSPDGRWIAYHTQSAAGWDVFVMPAAGGMRKWQVTTDGAVYPQWNHDGTELWVSKFNGDLHVYSVDGTGQTFRVGKFSHPLTVTSPDDEGCYYDLHPDGLRILQTGTDPAFRSEVSYLHLVTDWDRGLAQ
ncbi:MAG: serine/threonine-protein kinase [Candidatus Krumholzibacteria bacterium]|nr:serine/threonine-protein kinase [Candidatus Krumholzibacteria bacterium]